MSRITLALVAILLAALLILPPVIAEQAQPRSEQAQPRWTDAAEQTYSADERERIGGRHLQAGDDPAQAIHWFRSAAEAGSATALAYMGWFHEQGEGVEQDGDKAVHWYALAVEAGAEQYSLHLAWMFLQGEVVEHDRERADHWFEYGIEQGSSESMLAYGSVLYADMLAGDDDPAKGRRTQALLLAALEDGQMFAPRFLARMYFDGVGVEQDPELGLAAVRLGAGMGDPLMQTLLTQILADSAAD